MTGIKEALQNKDDKKAYALTKEIREKSSVSGEFYDCFDIFAELLPAKSSYVRARRVVLCCAQARWDKDGKLQKAMPAMLMLLHDEKPTVVRQCLNALQEVAVYRPELCGAIKAEIDIIDLSGYKDSMSPLIKKDIEELLKVMG